MVELPLQEDDESEEDDLPPFRFPSLDGNEYHDEYSDFVPQLESPSPSLDLNPLQEVRFFSSAQNNSALRHTRPARHCDGRSIVAKDGMHEA